MLLWQGPCDRFCLECRTTWRNGVKGGVDFLVTVDNAATQSFQAELQQILQDSGLSDSVQIE